MPAVARAGKRCVSVRTRPLLHLFKLISSVARECVPGFITYRPQGTVTSHGAGAELRRGLDHEHLQGLASMLCNGEDLIG